MTPLRNCCYTRNYVQSSAVAIDRGASACFVSRRWAGWKCFYFVQGRLFVRAVDGCSLGEGSFCFGNLSQINERESQSVCVARVADVIGFEQRSRGLEILNRLRVVFFLQVNLAERAQRQSLLQRGLLGPLIFGDIFRARSGISQRRGFLRVGLGFIKLFAFFSVIIRDQ